MRTLATLALLACCAIGLPASAGARHPKPAHGHRSADNGSTGLRFGIYPGGPIGSVGPIAKARPEDPVKRMAALQELRGGHPLVIHLYRSYWGGGAGQADDPGLDREIEQYTSAGLLVGLVARFRPEADDPEAAVAGYVQYLRALVDRYGANPGFVAIQVTNEANIDTSKDASDGAYPGVMEAMVDGTIAAKREIRHRHASQVEVGINWATEHDRESNREYWDSIGRRGGKRFAKAVDWVGLNSYPGTWSPLISSNDPLPDRNAETMVRNLRTLRHHLMPRAGLGPRVPIYVTETGWPTGPGRSDRTQAKVLEKTVRAVVRNGRRLNVTDFRWFDLRDSSSDDTSFESHYGLTTDDYTPKSAFYAFQREVARHSRTLCRKRPARLRRGYLSQRLRAGPVRVFLRFFRKRPRPKPRRGRCAPR